MDLFKMMFLFLMIFFSLTAYSNSPGLYVDNHKIYAYLISGKKVLIDNDYPIFIQNKSWIKKVSNDLWEVGTSCGSPCNETYYVDLGTGKQSAAFFLVTSVDPNKREVSYTNNFNKKVISHIF